MADVHSKKVRSYNMSQIKATDTKPELVVRRFLHGNGFRFRLNDKKVFGKPDLVLKRLKTVVFVHGCFWHGHKNCRYATIPKSNTAFWKKKIAGNIKRDEVVKRHLKKENWNIIILWECQLKPQKREKTLHKLLLQKAFHTKPKTKKALL